MTINKTNTNGIILLIILIGISVIIVSLFEKNNSIKEQNKPCKIITVDTSCDCVQIIFNNLNNK